MTGPTEVDRARNALQQRISTTKPIFLDMAEAGRRRMYWIDTSTALMPAGHNGPYFDIESPVRNSAHWLATMAIAFHLTAHEDFRTAGAALARYLEARSPAVNGETIHRQRFPKDWTNGIIGPAWLSEGLGLAGKYLGLESAQVAGAAGLRRLGFDEGVGLWRVHDPATGSASIDRTVNHQLYCTAIAAAFPEDETLRWRVNRFVDAAVCRIIRTDANGVLEHHVPEAAARRLKSAAVEQVRRRAGNVLRRAALVHGAVDDKDERNAGYHLFSLYSALRIADAASRRELLQIPAIIHAAETLPRLVATAGYRTSRFTFAYNPPGFELPFVALRHDTGGASPLARIAVDALDAQLEISLDSDAALFTRGTFDPLTLAARGFELGLLHV